MGLALTGLLGGLGQGMTNGANMAYKQAMDDKRIAGAQEFQTQRDDINNQRQVDAATVADTRQGARDQAKFEQGLESTRRTLQINQDFGATAMNDAKQAIADSGGDLVKAMRGARTPEAASAIKAMQDMSNDDLTTKSTLANGAASRAASYNSIANSGQARRDHQTDRSDIKANNALYAEYVDAQDASTANPNDRELSSRAGALRKQYIAASGKDPRGKQDGDYAAIMEGDEFGVKTLAGLYSKKTGEIRRGDGKGAETPTNATIAKLQANPGQAAAFDARFGAGSSSRYLQQSGAKDDAVPSAAPAVAPAQAPAQEQPRGLLGAAGDYISGLGVDYSTPQGKAELRRRAAEASNGGRPLTNIEKSRIQQFLK